MRSFKHVFEFKYLGFALDGVECCRKVVSGRKVGDVIRSLVNARNL